MSLADELARLQDLHARGALTDEEFARAKARAIELGGAAGPVDASGAPAVAAVNALRRSRDDRWLGGVCGGIARSVGIESWILRLVFAALAFFGGFGVLTYVLLWIFVPEE